MTPPRRPHRRADRGAHAAPLAVVLTIVLTLALSVVLAAPLAWQPAQASQGREALRTPSGTGAPAAQQAAPRRLLAGKADARRTKHQGKRLGKKDARRATQQKTRAAAAKKAAAQKTRRAKKAAAKQRPPLPSPAPVPVPIRVPVPVPVPSPVPSPSPVPVPVPSPVVTSPSPTSAPAPAGPTQAPTPTPTPTPSPTKPPKPQPSTVEDYRTMFYSLPHTYWGGADVGISTRLTDGRRLWLYGDTMSSGVGFVHSSAIVQDGFDLRVANRGQQILPNDPTSPDGTKNIYWIETVEALPDNKALIVAGPMALTPGGGIWGFRYRSEESRAAVVKVRPDGDVLFEGWVGWVERASVGMDGEDFRVEGPLHYSYGEFVHDIRLADGSWLETRNQNYGDSLDNHREPSGMLRYADWRPLFSSSPTRDNPYWGH